MSKLNAGKIAEDANTTGFYGEYGGRFVPEPLEPVLKEVEDAFLKYKDDPEFNAELVDMYQHWVGRPSPIFHCRNLSKKLGGAQIYLKREDLNHLGAHKVNNTIGQVMLAKRMGKKRLVAETGAGQHGVATAATAAIFNMPCIVYMGEVDMKRQALNVVRMQMMGTEVRAAMSGQRTLKEAVDEALICFVQDPEMFYVLGSAVGPHPYPAIVHHFQSVIGKEARQQCLDEIGSLPDAVIAAVGGGSNAAGAFAGFLDDESVALVGAEPGGKSLKYGEHAATLTKGKPGIIHCFKSYALMDEQGEAAPVYSISAGLDYPGVSPEHSNLKDIGRATFEPISDQEAVDAFLELSRTEGIIPALESSHALAQAMKMAPTMRPDQKILVNLSGRGDKDVDQVARRLGMPVD